MRHGLKVKIVKSSMESFWYADSIGEEFLVTHCMESCKYVLIQEYSKEKFVPHMRYISMSDVEVLSQFRYTSYFSSEITLYDVKP